MTDKVDGTACLADNRLHDIDFVPDGRIARATAFGSAAIAKQTCGDAAKAVAPGRHHRTPRRAGAARPGYEHNGRAGSACLVVDASACILDHVNAPARADG